MCDCASLKSLCAFCYLTKFRIFFVFHNSTETMYRFWYYYFKTRCSSSHNFMAIKQVKLVHALITLSCMGCVRVSVWVCYRRVFVYSWPSLSYGTVWWCMVGNGNMRCRQTITSPFLCSTTFLEIERWSFSSEHRLNTFMTSTTK
jgi:hypothetical protein